LEADVAISKSLYTAKSFIENGNKCKTHAITNETQYINSLRVEFKIESVAAVNECASGLSTADMEVNESETFDQNVDMDVDVVEGDCTLGCDCGSYTDMVFCS
jgi:hypothetical protein